MDSSIKILSTLVRTSKEGKEYKVIFALIEINGVEFVRKFYIWT